MRRPDILKQKLIEGLEQAEVDCYLPQVTVHKSFNQFIKYDLFCHGFIDPSVDGNHLKFVTQPLYPVMIKKDPVTSIIHQLPPSRRFSSIFHQNYKYQNTQSSSSIDSNLLRGKFCIHVMLIIKLLSFND